MTDLTRPEVLAGRSLAALDAPGSAPKLPSTLSRQAIESLADAGSFVECDAGLNAGDPLRFADRRSYAERLAEARHGRKSHEAFVYGDALLQGTPLVVGAFDFGFLGGGLGCAVGEKLCRLFNRAASRRVPAVVLHRSGGARLQEGTWSLLQMAKVCAAIGRFRRLGPLYVSVLGDPTMGGVLASSGALGDVILAEPGARIGFAGARVVRATLGLAMPPGAQCSETLLSNGFVDAIVEPRDLRSTLDRIFMAHGPEGGDPPAPATPRRDPAPGEVRARMDTIRAARRMDRPRFGRFLRAICDDFFELCGDRVRADAPGLRGGLARIGRRRIMLVGIDRGQSLDDLRRCNFGMCGPAGYRKAARLLRLAARLRLPVVTLVDTPGADPTPAAEEEGIGFWIAETIRLLVGLPVASVGVIVGEGGSGGALALSAVDHLIMLENTHYSVISPEGCAAILWRTREATRRAAEEMRSTAADLVACGLADELVPERDLPPEAVMLQTKMAVIRALAAMERIDPATLEQRRMERLARDHPHLRGGGDGV